MVNESSDLVWAPPFLLIQAEDGSVRPPDDGYQFRLPLAQTWRLLDLHDCVSDLNSVIAIGEALETQLAGGDFSFDLFNALVITYGRGFQSGKSRAPSESRANLRQFVDQLTPERRQQHDEVMEVRNRRVAHSVDTGGAVVTATFARDGSFLDLGAVHMGLPVGMADVRKVVALATELLELAFAEVDRLTGELRQAWSGEVLTPEQSEAAERNLAAYMEAVNRRP